MQVRRHSHPKARPETPAADPPPHSGIDYLALLDDQYTRGVAGKVNYAALLGDQQPPADEDTADPDTPQNDQAADEDDDRPEEQP